MSSWREQDALTQACCRERNESIALGSDLSQFHSAFHAFECECDDADCTEKTRLTVAEYECVREFPARFLIATNHENPEVEWVVSERTRFTVVETLAGEASKTALRTNPRLLAYPAGLPHA
jgi:hypothetical protein